MKGQFRTGPRGEDIWRCGDCEHEIWIPGGKDDDPRDPAQPSRPPASQSVRNEIWIPRDSAQAMNRRINEHGLQRHAPRCVGHAEHRLAIWPKQAPRFCGQRCAAAWAEAMTERWNWCWRHSEWGEACPQCPEER